MQNSERVLIVAQNSELCNTFRLCFCTFVAMHKMEVCELYRIVNFLCKERNLSIAKMCSEVGISKSVFSELKSGRTKNLSPTNCAKVAEYFGVSVDFLLGMTPDSYLIELKGEFEDVTAALVSDPDNSELQLRYDLLKDQIEDEELIASLGITKKDPFAIAGEEVYEGKNSYAPEDAELDDDTLLILDLLGKLTPSNRDRAIAYLQGLVAGQS